MIVSDKFDTVKLSTGPKMNDRKSCARLEGCSVGCRLEWFPESSLPPPLNIRKFLASLQLHCYVKNWTSIVHSNVRLLVIVRQYPTLRVSDMLRKLIKLYSSFIVKCVTCWQSFPLLTKFRYIEKIWKCGHEVNMKKAKNATSI